MAAANPIVLPGKQPLKSLNRSPKFLRHGYNVKGNAAKRKSAVELLQESKAFYVKSEQVLDSKQELKHTEHLQVTSNPSYDTLLRHPTIRTSGQHGVHDDPTTTTTTTTMMMTMTMTTSPATSMVAQRVLDSQAYIEHQHKRSSSHGVESKFMTVTLLGSARLHNHKSGVHTVVDNAGRNRTTITRVSSHVSCNPTIHRTVQTESYVQHQQLVGSIVSSSSGSSSSAPKTLTTTTTSNSTSTNRSPRSPHVRSKTQPETSTCPSSSAGPLTPQYRRSFSERDNAYPSSDDVQMKLRRLLNTDSKENLSATSNGGNSADCVTCSSSYSPAAINEKNMHNSRPRQAVGSEAAAAAAVVAVDSSAFIKPRHQQEGNYCIHKSMPDLSPLQLGQGHLRRRRSDGSNDSMSVKAPKSADLKPPSWTTSDYVSRSPSSHHGPPCFPSVRPMDYSQDEVGGRRQTEQMISSRHLLRGERVSLDEGGDDDVDGEGDDDDDDDDSTGAEIVGNLVTQGVRRRPIFRSKSDISHRYSKSGTDLSSTGSPSKRNSRCGAELERFFDTMGLDSSVLYVLNTPPSDQCTSPVFFASVSSSPSSNNSLAGGRCCCNGGTEMNGDHHVMSKACQNVDEGHSKDGLNNASLVQHGPVETSIVERNARVIKWLFNCRKMTSQGAMKSSSTGWMKHHVDP